jgi:hypothetical protein
MISLSLEGESQTTGPLTDENPKNNAYGKRERERERDERLCLFGMTLLL